MAQLSISTFFDPELIVPSTDNASKLEFWVRLQEWTSDPRPRIGPRVYAYLEALASKQPNVKGLSPAEFWKIIGKLVPRLHASSNQIREICDAHIRAVYRPRLGSDDNIEALIDSLQNSPDACGIALATDIRCWAAEISTRECNICADDDISMFTTPLDNNADAWRRRYLKVGGGDIDLLKANAHSLFPALIFANSAWNKVNALGGDVAEIAEKLVVHLGAINDHAVEIWQNHTLPADRQSQFGSMGVDISPESPGVRASQKAMSVRTFDFVGKRGVRCEWHTKLEPNRNRIYFAVEGGVTYVGAIIDHL